MGSTDGPYRISLVCAGNICRSPIAEVVLRDRLERAGLAGRVVVDSYGTGGWHVGQPADPRAVAALSTVGYDGSAHRARKWAAPEARRTDDPPADLVLALDRENLAALRRTPMRAGQLRLLRDWDPTVPPGRAADVPDPFYGDDADFADVVEIVERCADGLVDELRRRLEGPAPS